MAVQVTEENFQKEILEAEKLVLADFYSDSCIPCRRMAPILSKAEEKYGEKIKIAKLNVNFLSGLTGTYCVMKAPTLIFFQKGKELGRMSGVVSQKELEKEIEEKLAD